MRPVPLVTEPGDAVVRITLSTICGSDLHLYYNEVPGMRVSERGDVMGHECVGVVESVGQDVQHFKPGDRVVVAADIACGSCEYCRKEQYSACDTTNFSGQVCGDASDYLDSHQIQTESLYGHRMGGLLGYGALAGHFEGCQAEFVRVPIADVNLLKLPDSLEDEQALCLADIACTGWHGNELCELSQGENLVVFGAGPVGLCTAYLAKQVRGAHRVIVVDSNWFRLDLAAKYCGAETLNYRHHDPVELIQQTMPGGPDCVIDATGFRFTKTWAHSLMRTAHMETDSCEVLTEAIKIVKKCGRIGILGDYFGVTNAFPIGALMEKGLTLRGGQLFAQKYWRTLLPLFEQNRIDFSWVFTHKFPLEDAAHAYELFAKQKDNCIKVLLQTPFGLQQSVQSTGRKVNLPNLQLHGDNIRPGPKEPQPYSSSSGISSKYDTTEAGNPRFSASQRGGVVVDEEKRQGDTDQPRVATSFRQD